VAMYKKFTLQSVYENIEKYTFANEVALAL
jgi:hypothetical protein